MTKEKKIKIAKTYLGFLGVGAIVAIFVFAGWETITGLLAFISMMGFVLSVVYAVIVCISKGEF